MATPNLSNKATSDLTSNVRGSVPSSRNTTTEVTSTPHNFDIENLLNNEFTKVEIAFPKGKKITSFIQQEFSVGGSSEFNSPFESQSQQALSDKLNMGVAAINRWFGANISQFQLKRIEQTIKSWTGSSTPSFSLTLLFVAIRPEDDVGDSVRELLRGVYPIISASSGIIKAPLGYTIGTSSAKKGFQLTGKPKGTITIFIGSWFKAPNQILRSVNATFSKEIIGSGLPLYAKCDIQFEPYRLVSAKEIASYLVSGFKR